MKKQIYRGIYGLGIAVVVYSFIKLTGAERVIISGIGGMMVGFGSIGWSD